MARPFFSVVVPLYNKAEYIQRTLDSVLNQSFEDFEIIVIDDGSTDGGHLIVAGLKDTRIKVIRKKNGGVSSARNRGIKESNGLFIAFLDADDEWHRDKLLLNRLFISNNSDCYWLTSAYTINGRRKVDIRYCHTTVLKDALQAIANGLSICTDTVVVHSSCLGNDILFDETVNRSEDREVWLKLACKYPYIGYIQNSLAVYNILTPNNSMSSVTIDDNMYFLTMESRLFAFMINLPHSRKEYLMTYIHRSNKRGLINHWCLRNKTNFLKIKQFLEPYFSSPTIWAMYITINLPRRIKFVIAKFI